MAEVPVISICMPAYNAALFIEETINSIIKQSFYNWELIIVNDGSTDATAKLLDQITDKRIIIINSLNQGAAATRNLAFNKSSGEYIVFFDADDLMSPNFLEAQLKKMNNTDNTVVLSAWGRFYDTDLSTFKLHPLPQNINNFTDWIKVHWYKADPMTNPGRILISREVAIKAGQWNEALTLNDDLEYFTRVFINSESIILNPDAVLYYRSGIKGLSGKKGDAAFQSLYLSLNLSVSLVLKTFISDKAVRKSCANMWQLMLYEVYPDFTAIAAKIKENIDQLGGSDLAFPAGGYTKLLAAVIGWKSTKRLKQLWNIR